MMYYLIRKHKKGLKMDNIEFEYLLKEKIQRSKYKTLKAFAENGLKTSQANLTQRLKRASFDCLELYKIADLLGYDIEWVKRENK